MMLKDAAMLTYMHANIMEIWKRLATARNSLWKDLQNLAKARKSL